MAYDTNKYIIIPCSRAAASPPDSSVLEAHSQCCVISEPGEICAYTVRHTVIRQFRYISNHYHQNLWHEKKSDSMVISRSWRPGGTESYSVML